MVDSNTKVSASCSTVILLCVLCIRIYLAIQCSKPSLNCGNKEWVFWWTYSAVPFSLSGSIRLVSVLRFSHWAFEEVSRVREMKAFNTQSQCFLEGCAFCFPHHIVFKKRLCRQGDVQELGEGRQDQIEPPIAWWEHWQVIKNHVHKLAELPYLYGWKQLPQTLVKIKVQ